MPDRKKDPEKFSAQDAMETKKRMESLAQAIRDEMASMTQEELERLYASIALMGLTQDE